MIFVPRRQTGSTKTFFGILGRNQRINSSRGFATYTLNKPGTSSQTGPIPHPVVRCTQCTNPGCDQMRCTGLCTHFLKAEDIAHGTHSKPNVDHGVVIELSKTDFTRKPKTQFGVVYHTPNSADDTKEYPAGTKKLKDEPQILNRIYEAKQKMSKDKKNPPGGGDDIC
jgi:hypothetical protein